MKKVHRVIKFNENACLKQYIDINTNLRKKVKNVFGKDFFKLMNNSIFGKAMQNVRKHRDIKLVTTERGRIYLVSEPLYTSKQMIFKKTLYKVLKLDMILQIMN